MFIGKKKTPCIITICLKKFCDCIFLLHGCSILCISTYLLYTQINISGKCELLSTKERGPVQQDDYKRWHGLLISLKSH
jgi:hypothetical protein